MDHFSISDLAAYSGIKAHTIRIWERRYQALSPKRSEGNTRYYDNSQLRRLLNIVSLMDSGFKVMDLCTLSDDRLFELVNQNIPETTGQDGYFIAQLVSAGLNYNEILFEKIFGICILRYGLKDTYLKVIYPLLERIGMMWAGNSIAPASEHFISNLLRQKLFSAIDALIPAERDKETWLLLLPENEFHELGLLLAHYMIRASGRQSVYLGSNLPSSSVAAALPVLNPQKLLIFFVHQYWPESMNNYLEEIWNLFTGKNIYVAGNATCTAGHRKDQKTVWLNSVAELEQLLK